MPAALVDYHIHTPLCRHATGSPAEYVQAAIDAELEEIGFSDHCPMDGQEPFDDWRMLREELPRYFEMIEEARAQFPEFPIRLGLECDYIAGHEKWIEELAGMADWDYLIGAVHYLQPGWDFDNPKWIGRFTESSTSIEEIWELYWHHYTQAIRSGLFDFMAHPDLVKKFGHRPIPKTDLSRYYEPAIAAAKEMNVALEVSTAGLRCPVNEIYPSQDFLQLVREANIPILVSSDAHTPLHVAHHFDEAVSLVRGIGFTHTSRFSKRQRHETPLFTKMESLN